MNSSRIQRLWPYLVRYKWPFLVGSALLVATNVFALRIPRQIGGAVQLLQDARNAGVAADLDQIAAFATAIALLALGAGLTRVLSRVAIFNAARLVEYDIRNEVFEHLTRLDAATFAESSTGDLASRCINDVTQIRLLFGVGVLNVVNTAIAYSVVLTLMFSLSPRLALLSLVPYPFILLVMRYITRALYTTSRDAQEQLSTLTTTAQETLSGIAVVKAFAIEQRMADTFRRDADVYVQRNLKVAIARGGLIPFMRVAAGVGTIIVLWFGGKQVISGQLQLGQFIEFSSYVAQLAWPTLALGWVLSVWNRGTASFDRTCQILDTNPGVDPRVAGRVVPEWSQTTPPTVPDITFHNVGLTYPDGSVALHDVNLEIKAGTTVAIVGRTGGGKSSLVQLVPRLRDPSAGRITFGGVPLPELDVSVLRDAIGYVPQDAFLFSKPLRDNLLLGAGPDADLDRALELAALDADLAALPDGLDTLVGERGVTLSGGQRQRATLARAIARDPRVLILDDALSAVDTATERRILDGLRTVIGGRTTVLVTHRYNALDLVDEVVVLEDGTITERGHHRALIAQGGRYAEMVRKQQLEEQAAQFGGEHADAPHDSPGDASNHSSDNDGGAA